MCGEPILWAPNYTPCLQIVLSVGGGEGLQGKARVEGDVEEHRDRTSERDTERGICKVEGKEERE